MLKNLRLNQKINILLLTVFAIAIILSGIGFAAILHRNTEQQVSNRAIVLLETMLSVREYTLNEVAPELNPRLETESEFLPQTVPAYSAREVFEVLRKKSEYANFFYKEATVNPTNLRDKADSFETELVTRFKNNSKLKEITGYRSSATNLFFIARPIAVNEESCLRCHSTPDAAPKSLLATYGSTNGFDWRLNDIVGTQLIYVPASSVDVTTRRDFFLLMAMIAVAFAASLMLINFLLKCIVVRPLREMAKVANEISLGNTQAQFERITGDDIGKIATAINRLKNSLAMNKNTLEGK